MFLDSSCSYSPRSRLVLGLRIISSHIPYFREHPKGYRILTYPLDCLGTIVFIAFPLCMERSIIINQAKHPRVSNHATLERRRREKINHCLDQLKIMIPDCRKQSHLQKLEILELTVEYIRKIGIGNDIQTSSQESLKSNTTLEQELDKTSGINAQLPSSPAVTCFSMHFINGHPMALSNLVHSDSISINKK